MCGYGKERRERKETQPGVSKPWQPVRKYHISKICFSGIWNKRIFQFVQVDSIGYNKTQFFFLILNNSEFFDESYENFFFKIHV